MTAPLTHNDAVAIGDAAAIQQWSTAITLILQDAAKAGLPITVPTTNALLKTAPPGTPPVAPISSIVAPAAMLTYGHALLLSRPVNRS